MKRSLFIIQFWKLPNCYSIHESRENSADENLCNRWTADFTENFMKTLGNCVNLNPKRDRDPKQWKITHLFNFFKKIVQLNSVCSAQMNSHYFVLSINKLGMETEVQFQVILKSRFFFQDPSLKCRKKMFSIEYNFKYNTYFGHANANHIHFRIWSHVFV